MHRSIPLAAAAVALLLPVGAFAHFRLLAPTSISNSGFSLLRAIRRS